MTHPKLKDLARALLEYAEKMYLERCVAISLLRKIDNPAAHLLFEVAIDDLKGPIRQQFQPLYDQLEAATVDQEIQDAIEEFLKKPPTGLPN